MSGISTSSNDLQVTAVPTTAVDAALFVSVVIPIRNEERFIAQTLEGILAQDYPVDRREILVVDGDSSDGTVEVVKRYAAADESVRLLHNPNRWSSSARNIGVQAARGDVVVVVDGHCQFENNKYLRNLARAFRDEQVDCVGRPQPLDIEGGTPLQMAIAAARSSSLGHHPDSFIYSDKEQLVPAHSVGVAYRRRVFEKAGFFDESFDACEDVEFNHRIDKLGMKCLLAPSVQLRYCPRSTIGGLMQQMGRYGRGRVRLFRKHIDTFSLKSFLPALFVVYLLIGWIPCATLSVLGGPMWSRWMWGGMFGAGLGIYLTVVLLYTFALAFSHRRWSFLWLVPPVYVGIHVGSGWGSLCEFLGIRRKRG